MEEKNFMRQKRTMKVILENEKKMREITIKIYESEERENNRE